MWKGDLSGLFTEYYNSISSNRNKTLVLLCREVNIHETNHLLLNVGGKTVTLWSKWFDFTPVI